MSKKRRRSSSSSSSSSPSLYHERRTLEVQCFSSLNIPVQISFSAAGKEALSSNKLPNRFPEQSSDIVDTSVFSSDREVEEALLGGAEFSCLPLSSSITSSSFPPLEKRAKLQHRADHNFDFDQNVFLEDLQFHLDSSSDEDTTVLHTQQPLNTEWKGSRRSKQTVTSSLSIAKMKLLDEKVCNNNICPTDDLDQADLTFRSCRNPYI